MRDAYFRFSHDHWPLMRFSFNAFMKTAEELVQLATAASPALKVEVITCEDLETYMYNNITFDTDEVVVALQQRRRYPLAAFTEEVWKRSLDVQLTLTDPASPDHFMITLSCDRRGERGRLFFYGQEVDRTLRADICARFMRTGMIMLGNGFPKPAKHNYEFGKRLLSAG